MTAPRIGLNDDGSLDELVSRDVESFHFEAMAATWREQADTISAPSRLLEVACPTCDGTPPVVEELLPPLEALARNPLRRMLEAAINRRAT